MKTVDGGVTRPSLIGTTADGMKMKWAAVAELSRRMNRMCNGSRVCGRSNRVDEDVVQVMQVDDTGSGFYCLLAWRPFARTKLEGQKGSGKGWVQPEIQGGGLNRLRTDRRMFQEHPGSSFLSCIHG